MESRFLGRRFAKAGAVVLFLAHLSVLPLAAPAHAGNFGRLYGATGGAGGGGGPSGPSDLYLLDPATGAASSTIGPIGHAVTGLALHPSTLVLYGVTTGNTACSRCLITINVTTGAGTVVGPLNRVVADITFTSDGTLYGWSENGDDLATIDLVTGATTIVGNSSLTTFGSGLAANTANTLLLAGNGRNGALRTIDRLTGAVTSSVSLNGPDDDAIGALSFSCSGTLYGSLNEFDVVPQGSRLITINPATGAVTVLGLSVSNLDAIAFDCVSNDNPVANDDAADVLLDVSPSVTVDVLANDTDNAPLNTSTVTITSPPSSGTVLVNPDRTITYTAPPDTFGTVTFEYQVCDNGTPSLCDTATVTITITTSAGPCTRLGGPGGDTFSGTSGTDVLCGAGGADTLQGAGGNDVIVGGSGNDIVQGGDGNDVLAGGDGNDIVQGGAGNDQLRGEGGSDTVQGGVGTDTADGGPGTDSCSQNETQTGCP